jgi:periplasmic divalent cation tolerance protein
LARTYGIRDEIGWPMTDKIVVLLTCGSRRQARKIGRALVEAELVACVNLLDVPIDSIYRWKGRVELAKEFLIILKTTRRHFRAIEREVRRLHSYQVPEIIALPIERGSPDYLKWLSQSV